VDSSITPKGDAVLADIANEILRVGPRSITSSGLRIQVIAVLGKSAQCGEYHTSLARVRVELAVKALVKQYGVPEDVLEGVVSYHDHAQKTKGVKFLVVS